MRDDATLTFDMYLLGKKLRLLYFLHERLYSFAEFSKCAKNPYYRVTLDATFDKFMLEIRGTELMSVDDRLLLHSKLYKKLKPANDVKLGDNGQCVFFNNLEELYVETAN